MIRLRAYLDPDEKPAVPTTFGTKRNEHEVRCGLCARSVYVTEETFHFVNEAIESGLDSPFRCEMCAEEYDDLVYEG